MSWLDDPRRGPGLTVAAIACALSLSLALFDLTIDVLSMGADFELRFTQAQSGPDHPSP